MELGNFQCTICGGIFSKVITDEEAEREALELFGPTLVTEGTCSTVCSDCFGKISPLLHPELLEQAKKEAANRNPN